MATTTRQGETVKKHRARLRAFSVTPKVEANYASELFFHCQAIASLSLCKSDSSGQSKRCPAVKMIFPRLGS